MCNHRSSIKERLVRSSRITLFVASSLCGLVLSASAHAVDITQDTQLDPNKTYGPLVIKASNITIDGRGTTLVGDNTLPANKRNGIAILAEGSRMSR